MDSDTWGVCGENMQVLEAGCSCVLAVFGSGARRCGNVCRWVVGRPVVSFCYWICIATWPTDVARVRAV